MVTATFSVCQGESSRSPVHTLPFLPGLKQQLGTPRVEWSQVNTESGREEPEVQLTSEPPFPYSVNI